MIGRKPNDNTRYNMIVHRSNNYIYAATIFTEFNNNKRINKYKHWGKLDNNFVFYPNIDFEMLPSNEQRKFKYTDNWDLSVLHAKNCNIFFDNLIIDKNNKFDNFFNTMYNFMEYKCQKSKLKDKKLDKQVDLLSKKSVNGKK